MKEVEKQVEQRTEVCEAELSSEKNTAQNGQLKNIMGWREELLGME